MRRIWNEEGPLVRVAVVVLAAAVLVPVLIAALLLTRPDFIKHDCSPDYRAVICLDGFDEG